MASSQSKETLSAVEQKKHELLRRVQEKKAGKQPVSSSSALSRPNTDNPAPSSGFLFNNDGNFLARFQAMQQQTSAQVQPQEQSTNSPSSANEANSKETKITVTMKVVKKPVPTTKVKPSHFDVFDVPDGDNDGNVLTCNFVNSFGFIVN